MPEVIKTILTADSSELRAEFGKAAAVAADYQAKQQAGFAKAVDANRFETEALKLQAKGFNQAASSLREFVALREQAAAFARQANIPEAEAMRLLGEKLTLQKQIVAATQQQAAAAARATSRTAAIANPRATGLPGGGGLAPLTPQSLQAMDRAIASQRELRRQTLAAGQSGKSGALGFLAFSQAVEDAQYGIKGVLNNIPQMILGFGGTAGLAGVLSLAAVAAAALYPHLQKLFGNEAIDRQEKVAKAMDEVWKKGKLAAAAIREDAASAEKLKQLAADTNEYLRARLQIGTVLAKQNDEQLQLDRSARARAKELFEAKLALSALQGRNQDPLRDISARGDIGGLEADLVNRNKELLRVQQEVLRVAETSGNVIAEDQARQKADVETLVRLTERLTVAQTKLGGVSTEKKELQDAGVLVKGTYGDLGVREIQAAAGVKAIEKEIEAFQARKKVLDDTTAAAVAEAKTTISAANDKTNATYQEVEALKAEIKQRKELLEIAQKSAEVTRAASAWKAMQDAIKKSAEEADKAADSGEKLVEQAKAAAAEMKARNAARADFGTEIAALRLERDGQKEKARLLREEMAMRNEAVALAQSLGVTEAQALRLLREKARLTEGLTTRNRGAVRNSDGRRLELAGGTPGFGGRVGLASGARLTGLRSSTLERRTRERAATPRSTDPALRELQKNNLLAEQMLEVFKSLGAV